MSLHTGIIGIKGDKRLQVDETREGKFLEKEML